MEIILPYGKDTRTIHTAEECEVLLPRNFETGSEDEVLAKALTEPMDKEPFSEFASDSKKLLVIVTDATRPTPTARVIEHLYPSLSVHPDVKFIVATGTHRPPTEEELGTMFGKFYREFRDRIHINDARNDALYTYMGRTTRGTEVWFNNMAIAADGIVAINNVKPHYFAGFTGGRKSFLPGIARYSTIETNHSHATSDAAQPMVLEGNPVAEDMEEAARLLKDKRIFSIQTVMTGDHRLYSVSAGDLFRSFATATHHAAELYSVPLKQKGNIVLTANPYPMDMNLYQSQHALENSKLALEPGGIMILVSSCWDGIGNPAFLELLDRVQTLEELWQVLENGYKLGYHKALRIMKLSSTVDIWAVTGLDDETVRRSKMRPYHGIQEALDDAVKMIRSRGESPRIIIIPSGGMTIPHITDGRDL